MIGGCILALKSFFPQLCLGENNGISIYLAKDITEYSCYLALKRFLDMDDAALTAMKTAAKQAYIDGAIAALAGDSASDTVCAKTVLVMTYVMQWTQLN